MRCLAFSLVALSLVAMPVRADPGDNSPIKIGMSTPLSGELRSTGETLKAGVEACLQQVNDAGGISGRKIELTVMDDGGDAVRTLENTRKIVSMPAAIALTSYVGTTSVNAVRDILSSARLPLVGVANGADSLRNPPHDYIFHVRASYQDEADEIVIQLDAQQLRRIAVLYYKDRDGMSALAGAQTAMARLAIRPEGFYGVDPAKPDIGKAVDALASLNLQAVMLFVPHAVASDFIRQMNAAGAYPQMITLSTLAADDRMSRALGSRARGVGASQVMPYPWTSTIPASREYLSAVKQAGGSPSYLGMEGCMNVKLIVAAIRRVSGALTREKLAAALEGNFDLGGYAVRFTPENRNGSRFVEMSVIGRDGRILR
jgi:branched-chain amino acid transport system substrate-binding protein